ncbi:hypothetical protein DRQ33_04875 [bacterium]|nr:MAG: hypothetical protein DRQ33_04875 [bacterium]
MLRRMILSVLVLITAAFGMEFELDILASCGSEDTTSGIGVMMDASNGYDTYDFPSMGFPPAFTLQFENPGGTPAYLVRDIRSAIDSVQIWDGMFINATTAEITLTWTPPVEIADSAELMITHYTPGDSDTTWFDMLVEDSISLFFGEWIQIVFRHTIEPIVDTIPPVILEYSIAEGETITDPTMPLSITVMDTATGINPSSIVFNLNEMDVSFLVTDSTIGDTTIFTYTPIIPYVLENILLFSVSDYQENTVRDTHYFYYALPDTGDTTSDSLHTITCMVMLADFSTDLSGSMVEILELGIYDTTDMSGRCVFDSLEEDTYTFKATRPGYMSQDTTVYVDSNFTLIFLLEPYDSGAFIVSGTITLEGVSGDLSNSIVTAIGMDSIPIIDTTDMTGYYELEIPLFGMYLITAEHEDFIPDTAIGMFYTDTTVNFHLMPEDKIAEKKNDEKRLYLSAHSDMWGNYVSITAINAIYVGIYDISGKLVHSFQCTDNIHYNISQEQLGSGIYYVRAFGIDDVRTVKIAIIK